MADPRFDDIFDDPANDVFKVVFFPDRIYHAQYLNATRSPRYRYNVREVRSVLDATVLKGEVYMDGLRLGNFLRLEYRASRLVEQVRERGRFLRGTVRCRVRLSPGDPARTAEATLKLHYCPWIDAHQVEVWETLEPIATGRHDVSVLDLMGRDGSITRVPAFGPALADVKALRQLEVAFHENDRDLPFGYRIGDPARDDNFARTHQEPRRAEPSSPENTVRNENYLIDFQRGWFLRAPDVEPVRYRNAMMEPDRNPDARPDNVIAMRWLVQREFGGSMVFFHEVTIPPGTVEGTHQHIGSEELYYVTRGRGVAYMAEGDDPATAGFETVEREVFGIGPKRCKALPVEPGSVIFTKSGGVHGIRNEGDEPLVFVAFLYHSA